MKNGELDRALGIGLKLPETGQVEFFPRLRRTWVKIDAEHLVESIVKIPSSEVKSKIAMSFFEEHLVNNLQTAPIDHRTESQVEVVKQYLSDEDLTTLENRD